MTCSVGVISTISSVSYWLVGFCAPRITSTSLKHW